MYISGIDWCLPIELLLRIEHLIKKYRMIHIEPICMSCTTRYAWSVQPTL